MIPKIIKKSSNKVNKKEKINYSTVGLLIEDYLQL